MYSRINRSHNQNSESSPTNQFAPRPFTVPNLTSSNPNIQAKNENTSRGKLHLNHTVLFN
ncbi:MAG TPA: hypothetical protein VK184_24475 [Nostocaceae cyanobacterium]|nr:hypothetical protein [Nostocaceae cyanobacterium]